MRTLRFWAYVFAALASMSLGVEVDRFLSARSSASIEAQGAAGSAASGAETRTKTPSEKLQEAIRARAKQVLAPESTDSALLEDALAWEPLSTRALWERMSPGSLAWVESIGREQIHPGVWDRGVQRMLGWPPAVWLAAFTVITLLLARSRMEQSFREGGGLRSGARLFGMLLAATGFGLIGADLFHAGGAWQPRSIVELWTTVDARSLESWGRRGWISLTLEWPAWLAFTSAGMLLAYLARPRLALRSYAYAVDPDVVRVRTVDLSRTLAYLESMRGWPPRLRRGERVVDSHPAD